MKLEEIYESHYSGLGVYLNSASPTDLLEGFEIAAREYPEVQKMLNALLEGNVLVNESVLSENSKVVLNASLRLLEYYKNSNNKDFNLRLEGILEEQQRGPDGRFIKGTAPAKEGFLGTVGRAIGKAAGAVWQGIKKVGAGIAAGFAGSAGKDKQGNTTPGFVDAVSVSPLATVPPKETLTTVQQLLSLGVKQEDINRLQKNQITGINITGADGKLVTVTFKGGQFYIKLEQTWKMEEPADPKAGTPTAPAQPAPAQPAPAQPAPTAPAQPAPAQPAPAPANESKFNIIHRKILKEFYRTNK